MLFYDSPNPAPNPRRVRIFAAEKGIEEADSEKIEYAADQILQRLRMMIQTEKDRRGY